MSVKALVGADRAPLAQYTGTVPMFAGEGFRFAAPHGSRNVRMRRITPPAR